MTHKTRSLLWQSLSAPIVSRMAVFRCKAEDSGLAPEERAELAGLERELSRMLREFMRDTREDRPC
jgi:hypothetical protein